MIIKFQHFNYIFLVFFNSTLGQGLQTSTYPAEVIFSIALAIFGLILFALLIGNMQVNLEPFFLKNFCIQIDRIISFSWRLLKFLVVMHLCAHEFSQVVDPCLSNAHWELVFIKRWTEGMSWTERIEFGS